MIRLRHSSSTAINVATSSPAAKQQQKPRNAARLQPPDDLLGLLLHGIGLPLDNLVKGTQRRRLRLPPPVRHLLHGDDQIPGPLVVFIHLAPFHGLRGPGQDAAAELAHRPQQLRQTAHPGIGLAPLPLRQRLNQGIHLVFGLLILQGQEHPCLDIHQVGSHGHKLAGHLQVHLLAPVQIRQILVQNQGNGDILYFDLILTQQEQDQVQGPLKILELLFSLDHLFQLINGTFQFACTLSKADHAAE